MRTPLEPLFESLRRRARTLINGGQRMNYYSPESPDGIGYWPLSEEECPCDIHFREYLASRDIGGKSIFHFGTGAHHFVGAGELGRGNPNYVLAVTASPEEHADYIDLIIQSPRLARFYKVIFTDIYTLDGASLPTFDIVTLFHLCEYWHPVKSAYAPLDDRKLLGLMIEKLKPGGQIIAYTRSRTWDKAQPLFDAAVDAKALRAAEPFKTLNVYAKV
jgi:SAM-dependent methyltransferase